MFKIFIILSQVGISFVYAGTQFAWVQKNRGQLDTGFCIEVDETSNLKNYLENDSDKYSLRVKDEKCRPEKVSYVFDTAKGKCYEADDETNGKLYFSKVKKVEKCKLMKTSFKVMNEKCYEVDLQSEGSLYYKKVNPQMCQDKDSLYTWIRSSDRSGKCYKVNSDGSTKLKVKKEMCRPESPVYRFVRSGSLKGYCLEQSGDPENDYSRKSLIINCKTEKTLFFFYKEQDKRSGKCFEVDTATRGDHYLNKVNASFCK